MLLNGYMRTLLLLRQEFLKLILLFYVLIKWKQELLSMKISNLMIIIETLIDKHFIF